VANDRTGHGTAHGGSGLREEAGLLALHLDGGRGGGSRGVLRGVGRGVGLARAGGSRGAAGRAGLRA
jgi:hypothetical protein